MGEKDRAVRIKKIKLFMASPSDTSGEREAFTAVVASISRSRGEKEGFHLEPILWEKYAYPEAENPQTIIDKLLDDAELVVVVFWSKFGAPTQKFPSGTMEELFLALSKRKTTGAPSIKIYFRTPLPPKSVQDTEELKKIFEIKEAIKDKALYREFDTVEDFKSLLHEHINGWLSDYGSNRRTKKRDGKRKISKPVLREPSNCKEILRDVFEKVKKKYEGEKSKISFGIEDLDDGIGEIDDLNFLVVGGDMASGKTSLMLALAYNTAVLNGIPTLYFTMRSSKQDIVNELLSSTSQVSLDYLKKGLLRKEDWSKLVAAAGRVMDAPLFFDDNPQMSISDIKDQILGFKNKHSIRLVIIDEVNYLTDAKASIGKKLRLLSRHLQLPVISAVHLNIPNRLVKHPFLNDLDSMGDLKKEADTIIFLARKKKGPYDLGRDIAQIIIAKNKNGPTMTLERYYSAETCSFGGDPRDD